MLVTLLSSLVSTVKAGGNRGSATSSSQSWTPTSYQVLSLEDGSHYKDMQEYSRYHDVLLDPSLHHSGMLETRLAKLKANYDAGYYASKAEYERDVHRERVFNEAVKVISTPDQYRGALLVNGPEHVLYSSAITRAEVKRRHEVHMLPELYLDNGYYWLYYPEQGSETSSSHYA